MQREEELFHPIRAWLEGQGYRVSAEVRDCDIVARHPDRADELVVVELKRRISMELLAQAVRRQDIAEAVYVAVPLSGARSSIPNSRAVRTLLRRMEIGLLVVRKLRTGTRVEVVRHPGDGTPRARRRRREAMIREIDHRYGEFNVGGQTTHRTRYTAYRQQALLVAELLRLNGVCTPAQLRTAGAGESAGRVLSANHYGWFTRVARGRYALSDTGRAALETHRGVVAEIVSRTKA